MSQKIRLNEVELFAHPVSLSDSSSNSDAM